MYLHTTPRFLPHKLPIFDFSIRVEDFESLLMRFDVKTLFGGFAFTEGELTCQEKEKTEKWVLINLPMLLLSHYPWPHGE